MHILRPISENLFLLFFIIITAFFLFTALPADPVRSMLGVNVSEEVVAALRSELGLDRSLWIQFKMYVQGLITLDLGTSFVTRRPVSNDLFPSMVSSLLYAGFALVIAVIYSVASTFTSFFYRPFVGKTLQAMHASLVSIPGLIIAIIAGIILFHFDVFFFLSDIRVRQISTAAIVLSIYPSAVLSQILFQQFEEIKGKAYLLASKGFGFTKKQLFGILFKSSYLPWLAQLSNIAAALLAGSIVIEYVFSLPGLGRLIHQSVIRSDYPMLQGIVIVTSISYIIFNMFIETIYQYLKDSRGKAS